MAFPLRYGLLKLAPAGGEWKEELSAVVKAFSTLESLVRCLGIHSPVLDRARIIIVQENNILLSVSTTDR